MEKATYEELEDLIERQTEAINDCIDNIKLQKEEIKQQINRRKLAVQVRNWTIILSVIINLLIWLL
jgi:hypothetical protein